MGLLTVVVQSMKSKHQSLSRTFSLVIIHEGRVAFTLSW